MNFDSIYRGAIRPILFSQDAEQAHEFALRALELLDGVSGRKTMRPFSHPRLRTCVAGIEFPNPVGLAAGCDKHARAVRVWPRFGFGAVEVGTVTAEAQPGNPRPRIFRYPSEGAIINRLGFNSEGATTVSDRLAALRRETPQMGVPLGVNIGKTRNVAGENATLEDYRTSLRKLNRFADYIVINVSSPNTPGLRQWQERTRIQALMTTLQEESEILASKREIPAPPMFVKISPDMAEADMADIADVAMELKMGGIIATNTTIAREGAFASVTQAGGLSGQPLKQRATEVMRWLYRHTGGQIPLIGVGGISTAEDAYERIRAGASLVQVYTALIYQGPYLPQTICRGLVQLMERDSIHSLEDLVGVDARDR